MNSYIKNQYQQYLIEYLKQEHKIEIKNVKNNFNCPCCNTEEVATIYPSNNTRFYCVSPECSFQGDIFDLIRKTKNPKFKDEDVAHYLQHKYKIPIIDDIEDLLKLYEKNHFCMFPLEPGTKDPKEGFMWTEKEYRDRKIWNDWVDRGYGLGIRLGKPSKVIAIDIDSDETYKKMKDILGEDTLIQTTKRGRHWLFIYDDDFEFLTHANLRNKGYEMEIRSKNAYIAVAPTSANGEIRKWNNKKINKMPSELKEFLLKLIDKNTKSVDEEIQESINKDDVGKGLKGMDGCCNDTFIKIGGVLRKKMNIDLTKYALNVFNQALDDPMDKKSITGIIRQLDKYQTYDNQELAQEVIKRLDTIKQATAYQISGSLKKEIKDIEDVLKYLEDQDKVIHLGNRRYQLVQDVEWTTDKTDMSVPVDFQVPYFHDYNYFDWGNMVIIGGASGVGKCFGKGTKILMYDGSYKNVENIKIKDQIMGIDSKSRNVLQLSNGVDNLYKIIPNKGKSCIVNSRHMLSLKRTKDQKVVNISLNDYLKKGNDFKAKFKLYKKSINFKQQKVSLEPYFLGLWLGNGDSRDSRITNIDNVIKNYIKNYAKKLKLNFKVYKYGEKCPAFKISNDIGKGKKFSINGELKNLNLFQNKHIPNIYKYNTKEIRLQLLAGLLDADGYLHNGNFEIISKSKQLADDIRYLAGSLGFQVTESIKKVKLKTWNKYRKYYRLNIIGDCSIIPTKTKRKKAQKRKIKKDPLVSGFKIRKLKKGIYYGFELDGDNLHMIEDFVVHHNTHITGNIIKKLVDQGIKPYLITTEAGSKIGKITHKLGIPDENYYVPKNPVKHPMDIELVDNAITIIDWLKVKDGDYAKTDNTYEHFHNQLKKHGGFLFILTQLRKSNNEFFAMDQVEFYGSCVAKYLFGNNGADPENTLFQTQKLRDSRTGQQIITIPTHFGQDTKILDSV